MSRESVAVARGVKLLDQLAPGWVRKINKEYLDMADSGLCMLGQTFGDYGEGCRILAEKGLKQIAKKSGLTLHSSFEAEIEPAYYGFSDADGACDYKKLEAAWLSVLQSRKRAGASQKALKRRGRA